MSRQIQITEYGSFVCDKDIPGYQKLEKPLFDALENFILTNRSKDTDALELMGLSARKGIGKIITAKNYVGVIAMEDGTTIEILPKIYNGSDDDKKQIEDAKRLLIDMLRTLKQSPYKSFQSTDIKVEKMNIFEIFIRMFIDEVIGIAKRGFKSDYERVSSNEVFLKGKLLVNEDIKYNAAHRERCYVEYDEFNENCPENRLIKSTLDYLYTKTSSVKNKTDIKNLRNILSDVGSSEDYETDFAKIVPDRRTKEYSNALTWCHVFLQGRGFATYTGSDVAFSLLFPMETLYESYIAHFVKQIFGKDRYDVTAQDRTYHLFDNPRQFQMRPDIVLRDSGRPDIIMDTKWKILSKAYLNGGISQVDMYQMYAYYKKYTARTVFLLYPLTDEDNRDWKPEYTSADNVAVKVRFVDLLRPKESLRELLDEIKPVDIFLEAE